MLIIPSNTNEEGWQREQDLEFSFSSVLSLIQQILTEHLLWNRHMLAVGDKL